MGFKFIEEGNIYLDPVHQARTRLTPKKTRYFNCFWLKNEESNLL